MSAIPIYNLPGATGPVGSGKDSAFMGVSVRETGGAAAVTVKITDSTGKILYDRTIAASGSDDQWYGFQGKKATGQITVTYSGTGVPEGSIAAL